MSNIVRSTTGTRSLAAIAARAPVRPIQLAHVILATRDPAAMRDWYGRVLEARVVYENAMVCFMTYDEEHHRIGFVKPPQLAARSDDSAGTEHVGFTYSDLGSLLYTYRRLKAAEIVPYWTINHGPTLSLYYRDPDRNRIELFIDNFASSTEGQSFFTDGRYDENFMGILFDPEQLIARYEAGEPLSELTRRPPLPAGKTPWDMFRP